MNPITPPISGASAAHSASPRAFSVDTDQVIAALLNDAHIALDFDNTPLVAMRLFDEVLSLHPNHLEAHVGAGQSRLSLAKWLEASRHFEVAHGLDPLETDAIIGLGFARLHTHGQPEALAFLREAAPPAILAFADQPERMLEQLTDIAEPLTDGLKNALPELLAAVEPTFTEIASQLAAQSHPDPMGLALRIYDTLTDLGSETLSAWRAKSELLIALDQPAEARQSYLDMLNFASAEEQINILEEAGRRYLLADEPAFAIEFFEDVIRRCDAPGAPPDKRTAALIGLGASWMQVGNPHRASIPFTFASLLNPSSPEALLGLGLAKAPTNPVLAATLLMKAALLFMRSKTFELAHTTLLRARELVPNVPHLALLTGVNALERGRVSQAMNELQNLLDHPDIGELARHFAGRCQLAMGNTVQALLLFSQSWDCPVSGGVSGLYIGSLMSQLAKDTPPSNPNVKNYLDMALMGWQNALAHHPHNEEAKIGAADTLKMLGKTDRALQGAREVLRLNPDSVAALKLMASIQLDQGTLPLQTLEKLASRWSECTDLVTESLIGIADEAIHRARPPIA